MVVVWGTSSAYRWAVAAQVGSVVIAVGKIMGYILPFWSQSSYNIFFCLSREEMQRLKFLLRILYVDCTVLEIHVGAFHKQ